MMTPTKFLSNACPQTREAALTMIPVELLTAGVVIEVPGFGAAEVYDVRFDGEGYAIDYAMSDRGGWDDLDTHYVPAGQSVKFPGRGEPILRPESAVTNEEWRAKSDAIDADIFAMTDIMDARRGCVSRDVGPEMVAALADALWVSMQAAAE